MESGSSSGAHDVSQVQCTWRFDAWMNPRWWRIFAKVEFVRVVSNIVYKVGYSWTCSCICLHRMWSRVLVGHLYPRPLLYSGGRHTM